MHRDQQGRLRFGRVDWVMAGFARLAAEGAGAVRVERLARDLGTTKGSFYWHFKDLSDLHGEMLAAWADLAQDDLAALAGPADHPARDRLLHLVARAALLPEAEATGGALEPAIRDWARLDPVAARALARVDHARLAALAAVLAEAGLAATTARQGAEMVYAALLGLEALRRSTASPVAPALRAVAEAALALTGVCDPLLPARRPTAPPPMAASAAPPPVAASAAPPPVAASAALRWLPAAAQPHRGEAGARAMADRSTAPPRPGSSRRPFAPGGGLRAAAFGPPLVLGPQMAVPPPGG